MNKEKNEKLHNAVELVNEAIKKRTLQLQSFTQIEDASPIMLEGETTKGYYCQMMVDPKEVARIMLEYNYPMYAVLEEDAPIDMWDDIAAWFGLGSVSSVDI